MESHDHVKQICLQSQVRNDYIDWEERDLTHGLIARV